VGVGDRLERLEGRFFSPPVSEEALRLRRANTPEAAKVEVERLLRKVFDGRQPTEEESKEFLQEIKERARGRGGEGYY